LKILKALEERNERLHCPSICPPSIYSLLLLCWSLNSKDRPKFQRIVQLLNQYRPNQYRVIRDNKQINQLTLVRGDTVSVFDAFADKPLWKGQNHRTQQVGLFPRICLETTTTKTNDRISWPVKGSFIHTGHRHGTGQGPSWGKIDKIDEYDPSNIKNFKFFCSLFYCRTILSNPIVTPIDSNERDENVKSSFVRKILQSFVFFFAMIFFFCSVVSNILQLNETNNQTRAVVTRPAPPVPKAPPTISEDLFLIDFSDYSPVKSPENDILSFDPLILNETPSTMQNLPASPIIQTRFSNQTIDPQLFVANVVNGVTEQLKNDFPRLNIDKKDYTPPLVRKFTVPYPTSYYNTTQRPRP